MAGMVNKLRFMTYLFMYLYSIGESILKNYHFSCQCSPEMHVCLSVVDMVIKLLAWPYKSQVSMVKKINKGGNVILLMDQG